MKLAVKFTLLFLSIFILILCVVSMNQKSFQVNETHQIANESTFYPLKQASIPYYEKSTNEELVAEVLRQVVLSKQSDSDIKVQILGVDVENGMLDINIIQTFRHVNGQEEEISSRKTIILEEEL